MEELFIRVDKLIEDMEIYNKEVNDKFKYINNTMDNIDSKLDKLLEMSSNAKEL
jgi:hypothetical protein